MQARVKVALFDAGRQTLKIAVATLLFVSLVALALQQVVRHKRPCVVCGELILWEAYNVEPEFQDAYHAYHPFPDYCAYCGRVLAPYASAGPAVITLDGKHMCSVCHRTAVVQWDEAARIASEVRCRLKQWGLAFGAGAPPVALVDQATLKRLFDRAGLDGREIDGLTEDTSENGRLDTHIYIQSGLPRVRFRWAIAHELMHAWQFSHHAPVHRPRLEEGAAELTAYRLLRERPGAPEKRLIAMELANKDPVYGGGLRLARDYERKHGFSAFLKLLATHADFPVK